MISTNKIMQGSKIISSQFNYFIVMINKAD